MNTLIALALSTPIWGFSLQPPTYASPSILPAQLAQLDDGPATIDARSIDARRDAWEESHNASMMNWVRAFQASTTISMAVTGVLGFVQFHDEYGFHDEYRETACARGQGNAVLDYCGESTPWPHLIAAGSSASLLVSTVGISTEVDFDRASRRDRDWRTFETTRWIALGLGLAQGLAGAFLANAQRLDILSYESDFDAMQGLAVAHMALGAVNLGVNLYNTILLF